MYDHSIRCIRGNQAFILLKVINNLVFDLGKVSFTFFHLLWNADWRAWAQNRWKNIFYNAICGLKNLVAFFLFFYNLEIRTCKKPYFRNWVPPSEHFLNEFSRCMLPLQNPSLHNFNMNYKYWIGYGSVFTQSSLPITQSNYNKSLRLNWSGHIFLISTENTCAWTNITGTLRPHYVH